MLTITSSVTLLFGTTRRVPSMVRRLVSRQLTLSTTPCWPPRSTRSPIAKSSPSCSSSPAIRSLSSPWEAKPITAVSTAEVVISPSSSILRICRTTTTAIRPPKPSISSCTSNCGGRRHQPRLLGISRASHSTSRTAARHSSSSSARSSQRWAMGPSSARVSAPITTQLARAISTRRAGGRTRRRRRQISATATRATVASRANRRRCSSSISQ